MDVGCRSRLRYNPARSYRMGCLTFSSTSLFLLIVFTVRPAVLDRSLEQLGLSAGAAGLFFLAMILLAGFHLPLLRRRSSRFLKLDPLIILGMEGLYPGWERIRPVSTVAISLGGGLLPLSLAAIQVYRIAVSPSPALPLLALLITVGVSVAVSWKLSRALPIVGVALPGVAVALAVAATSLLLQAEAAAQFAVIAGALGPLVGAGLMRLPDTSRRPVALHSLGGAGTFNAILASLAAALLLG